MIPKPFADSIDIPAIFVGIGEPIVVEEKSDVNNVPKDTAWEAVSSYDTHNRSYTVYAPVGLFPK